MLRRLHIRNYLLIEELDLSLDEGLTIITGETGSGKSILIGALGLVMGERADAGALRDPSTRCVIELEVDLGGLELVTWFTANEIPYEEVTILRRQLEPGGRSRAFVNDTPVRLEQLRELGSRLVHIHSQHHALLLNDTRFQLGLIDQVAGHAKVVRDYSARYFAWHGSRKELDRLADEEMRAREELDFLLFQLNELNEAALRTDEQAGLEQELTRAEHGEELIASLQAVEGGIAEDRGLLELIVKVQQVLTKPAKLDAQVKALQDRLNSVRLEVQDIGDEAAAIAGAISVDPAAANRLRERLDVLLRLQQKHRVNSVEELLQIREDLEQRSAQYSSIEDRIKRLEREVKGLFEEVNTRALAISTARLEAMEPLAARVGTILRELGMPHAVFKFRHAVGEPGVHGSDSVQAFFSANKDRAVAPLEKVASGGELGRVMLALISLAADSQDLPTVVFDEVDTGVSGEVADRVGSLMARMAMERQVLAITHLPQIASKARQHLLVTKGTVGDQVRTAIDPLDMERRVEAIAQMLSGRKLTKQAMENARVLLKGK